MLSSVTSLKSVPDTPPSVNDTPHHSEQPSERTSWRGRVHNLLTRNLFSSKNIIGLLIDGVSQPVSSQGFTTATVAWKDASDRGVNRLDGNPLRPHVLDVVQRGLPALFSYLSALLQARPLLRVLYTLRVSCTLLCVCCARVVHFSVCVGHVRTGCEACYTHSCVVYTYVLDATTCCTHWCVLHTCCARVVHTCAGRGAERPPCALLLPLCPPPGTSPSFCTPHVPTSFFVCVLYTLRVCCTLMCVCWTPAHRTR